MAGNVTYVVEVEAQEEERKIYPHIPTPARQKGEKGAGCHPAQQQQRPST
ncbi:hypothetical protein DAPPUDRAFT_258279 [Daphnia pulex]|uniref:Uncharacterized protein n=1 Tax=Daphnia pulex TaxID=6669 RepID=E9HF30_DAPPU|nr:hypothetical protein DAPPUDRAFT_258279 [Daphnia pulex]|eukprot:EFX69620.1 hypothetical protein DAPPUDRAFT_258279 [Daphnia pulex]